MSHGDNGSAERPGEGRHRAALAVVGECCRLCRSDDGDLHGPFLSMVIRAFSVDRAAIYEPAALAGEFLLVEGAGFRGSAPARLSLGAPPPEFVAARPGGDNSAAGETLRRAFGVDWAVWRFDAEAGMALMVGATQDAGDSALDFSEDDREAVDAALSGFAGVRQAKSLEAELKKTRDRYSLLAENTLDVIWVVDLDLDYVFISPSITRARGWETEELTGRSVTDFMTPESAEKVREALAAGLADEQAGRPVADRSRVLELEMVASDGEHITGQVTPYFVRDAAGGVVAMAGVTDDITRRRQAEVAVRESQERYELLAANIEDIIFSLDLDLNFVYLSPSVTRSTGYEVEEVLGQSVLTALTPASTTAAQEVLAEELERELLGEWPSDRSRTIEVELLTKNGEPILAEVTLRFVRNEEGQAVALAGVARDIRARRQAEMALRESRETAWAMLNAANDMAALVDPDWIIEGANEAFIRRFGGGRPDVASVCMLDLMPPEVVEDRRRRMVEALSTGRPQRFESRVGATHFVSSLYPVAGDDGQVHHVAVFVRDITDRVQAEQAQRLAALGQLSAGVAHEFNNILAGIMLTMEHAGAVSGPDAREDLVDRVRQLARRGAKIAGNLSAFAQPGGAERRPVSVDDLLDSALAVTGTEVLQAGVLLERERGGDRTHVVANSAELAQVFVNLIINACHAMPDGGTLTVRTSRVSAHGGEDAVLVTLGDTGSGISAEHLPHVFEPFFTTKGPMSEGAALGTGLGLSVSHGIITSHGGMIEVESEPGLGTIFQVRLPASEAPPGVDAAGAMADEDEAVDGERPRVLVAEDEPDIGAMIAQVLERQGHRVDHVTTANEAVRLLEAETYDLVITDLLMPGGGGEGVLTAARSQDRRPLLMVITGHIGDELGAQLREQGVDVVLKKPFGVLELLRAVEEIMGGVDADA